MQRPATRARRRPSAAAWPGALLAGLALASCAILPPAPPRLPERTLAPAQTGTLAEQARRIREDAGRDSAFRLLADNREALLWRLALVDHATTSIDAQYYIWSNDEAGALLFEHVLMAADRGVRVRLLVDDLLVASSDRNLAAYARHPNLEIRLYNPGKVRESTLGALGHMIVNFRDMNRRMHNKLFVVDGLFAVVGGRNVGNPYFGLSDRYNFRDLDVLVAGPVVPEIAEAFDDYWNAEVAYPTREMRADVTRADLAALRQRLTNGLAERREILASYPLQAEDWSPLLATLQGSLQHGEAHFLQDEPVASSAGQLRLREMLGRLAAPSHEEMLIITPYLIPAGNFLANLAGLEADGVDVKILTASMGANNHTIAHSHYKKYRRKILATGADLYEFRHEPSETVRAAADVPPVRSRFVSLHIKALVGDRRRCFIGSLNLDPRALEINTENGLYIESPQLAVNLARLFDELSDEHNAWKVEPDERGRLRWLTFGKTVSRQPARSFGQRVADFFFRLLPVESQL